MLTDFAAAVAMEEGRDAAHPTPLCRLRSCRVREYLGQTLGARPTLGEVALLCVAEVCFSALTGERASGWYRLRHMWRCPANADAA